MKVKYEEKRKDTSAKWHQEHDQSQIAKLSSKTEKSALALGRGAIQEGSLKFMGSQTTV